MQYELQQAKPQKARKKPEQSEGETPNLSV